MLLRERCQAADHILAGRTKAAELYDVRGWRTLDDMKRSGEFNFTWHDDLQLK